MQLLATHRPPAVAGVFYPAQAQALRQGIQAAIDLSKTSHLKSAPKALLIPHAGYIYSGPIAASAYATLRPWASQYRRVVLIGPAHHLHFRGIAIPEVSSFTTPLGDVPLDQVSLDEITQLPGVLRLDAAHEHEHALEVQLPFLQEILADFVLVPLLVGLADPGEVAAVVKSLWYGPETLIVISSDLSHYLSYANAQVEDLRTIDHILKLDPFLLPEQACGALPLSGFLQEAQHHHLSPCLLDYRNSGDTAGSKDRVVGYASIAFA